MVDAVNEKIEMVVEMVVLKTIMNNHPTLTSMDEAKRRIKNFKKTIKKLSDPSISPKRKKVLAIEAMEVQIAIKRIKENMPEDRFFMFYRYAVEGYSIRTLSLEYGIDTKTVTRAMNTAYRALSIHLYPDLALNEILTVGR